MLQQCSIWAGDSALRWWFRHGTPPASAMDSGQLHPGL
jgi:hypothetical protein